MFMRRRTTPNSSRIHLKQLCVRKIVVIAEVLMKIQQDTDAFVFFFTFLLFCCVDDV